MKNVSILLLFMLATFGLWVLSSAYILAPFWGPGVGHRLYLSLFTLPDLLAVIIFGAWAILTARLGSVFFAGSAAPRFRFAATAFVVFLFLYGRGAFIPSNFGLEFLTQQLILAAVVSAAAWYGLRTHPTKSRNASSETK